MLRLLFILFVFISFSAQSQTIVFSENFETLPLSMSSSGTVNWGRSSTLQKTGLYSDSARIVNAYDTAILTSTAFSTLGMGYVSLTFDHICKLEYFDGGVVEVSTDNGQSWTRLTAAQYTGTGQFGGSGNRFSSVSYPLFWDPANNNAIPTNNWWQHEVFNLSSLAGNSNTVKIRFMLLDINGSGSAGNYGWLLDNISVKASSYELIPPSITLLPSSPIGTALGTGPFNISASVSDSSGIDTVLLIYSINSSAYDTTGMALDIYGNYSSHLPAQLIGTNFDYKITATDNSGSANMNETPIYSFTNTPDYKYVSVGNGTSGAYNTPVYNGTVSSTDSISDYVALYTPAELNGLFGQIDQIEWYKFDNNNFSGNARLEIYLSQTNASVVPTTSTALQGVINSATLVYSNTNQTLPTAAGYVSFNTSQNPFIYDGSSNLFVIVRWRRAGILSANYINWRYHVKAGGAETLYGSSLNPTTAIGTGNRADIRFRFTDPVFQYDAGIKSIQSPQTVTYANQSLPITVRIKNGSNSNLTKAKVYYQLDGTSYPVTNWTGNLQPGFNSNDIILGNHTLSLGNHSLKAWTSLPNDSIDQYLLNDTMRLNFYSCYTIFNGSYTVGDTSADFNTIDEVIFGLKNCGMVGPVTIKIKPGVYYVNLTIDDSIPGLDSINTLTFTSTTGNAEDVIIKKSTSNPSNFVIALNKAKYVKFSNLSIDGRENNATSGFYLLNGANNIIIDSCKIIMNTGSSIQNIGIYNYDVSSYNVFSNNKIIDGYYGIYLYSSTGAVNNLVINNLVSGFERNGIYSIKQTGIKINQNIIRKGYQPNGSTLVGIYIENSNEFEIIANDIQLEPYAATYGIYVNNSDGLLTESSLVANNMVIVENNSSTSTAFRAVYVASVSYVDLINNTFISSGGASATETGYIQGSGFTGFRVFNNVFANFSGNYAIEKTTTSAVSEMDYNAYFTTGGQIMSWDGIVIAKNSGISGINAVTQMDSNSIITNPMIYSMKDAHSYSPVLNGAAKPFASVIEDFDNDLRSATTPDIGADEYNLSTTDLSLINILNPLPTDTQNRIVNLALVVTNTGSDTINSFQISYKLNQSSVVVYNWTGQLLPAQTDTIFPGSVTIPALNNTLLVYSTLSGDTLNIFDTLNFNFYGLPLIEAELISINKPIDGCAKTATESLEVTIKNNGLQNLINGLSISYSVNGSTAITETISTPVPFGQTIDYTFASKLNMVVNNSDSLFNIKVWLSHQSDPKKLNDTLNRSVSSISLLPSPQINDTTITYGSSVTLKATSAYPVEWYINDTTSSILSKGINYTTPQLFDTTAYYLRANTSVPELTAFIGLGTSTFGFWDMSPYGGGGQQGRYQIIYTASELQAAGLASGLIKSLSFNVLSGGSTIGNMTISLAITPSNVASNNFENPTFTTVYNSPYTTVNGWNTHSFTTPFYWDGISNIMVQICTQGIAMFAPPVLYTSTSQAMYTATAGFGASCSSVSGQALLTRPNTKFETLGTAGCISQRIPVVVNVPRPSKDALIGSLISPISGCGISNTPVTVEIVNNGVDTIPSGFSASYKINNGSYITPEVISFSIAPADTLLYTFSTNASLPTSTDGANYVFTIKVNVPADAYSGNDTLVTDSVFSDYTPSNPVVSNISIPYGSSATLSGTASDTLYWFGDSLAINLLGIGNHFVTAPLYDTTTFFAQSRKTILSNNYTLGSGTAVVLGPSPYGSSSMAAKHQFLIRASELKALGMMKGFIYSIAFDASNVQGTNLSDYEIKVGNTSAVDLDRTIFIKNLTTVFSEPTFAEVYGWNVHPFQTPFYWDGNSNLVIETCFRNTSNRPYTGVKSSTTSFKSSANAVGTSVFSCVNDTVIQATYTSRPNIRFNQMGYGSCGSDLMPLNIVVTNFPSIDAGINEVILPAQVSSAIADTVKAVIKNYGTNNLTSAQIHWSDNGYNQSVVNWSGNLTAGQTDTVTLSNSHSFVGGISNIKAWSIVTGDSINSNDTASTSINICMSGVYTVKPAGGNFVTISQAIQNLEICGVCGPVIIDIDSGFYAGPYELNPIIGASFINNITFRGASLDSTKVSISATTLQNANYVFRINGASHINLSYLSLTANGSNYSNVVELKNAAQNITIENCVLTSGIAVSGEASNIIANGTAVDSVIIRNSVINNGYRSIYFNGSNSIISTNILIENNIVQNFTNFGVSLYYTSNVEIKNNLFSSSNNSTLYGIYSYYNNYMSIVANEINLVPNSSGYGMYLNTTGLALKPSLISNNFITILGGTQSVYGTYTTSSNYVDIVYNSMYINNQNTNTRSLYITSTSNVKVLNNNIYTTSGYVFYSNSINGITAMDYNNLYSYPASNWLVYYGANINNLNSLKQQDLSKNQHTYVVDPVYVSNTDLHAQELLLYNGGTPFPSVTTDIDGETRSTVSPSIGADEFTPPAIDLSTNSIVYPSGSDCGYSSSDSVVVSIKNLGLNNLNFSSSPATITLFVSGINPDTIIYNLNTGTLNSGSSMNVKLTSNYDMSANGAYQFIATISIQGDGFMANNQAPVLDMVSLPTITSFPFVMDFENGVNISFKETQANNSSVSVAGYAASTGLFGLHFEGGSAVNWTTPSNVTAAFNNTTHVSKASTCNIDATGLSTLSLKFDLKQTAYSPTTTQTNSWFRVLITNSLGTFYLKNQNGDSVFRPLSANADPFVTQIFNLNAYAGQVFSLSLEASNYYSYSTGAFDGDNAYVDNFTIWSPSSIDVGANSIIIDKKYGLTGSSKILKIALENFGTDTLFQIPIAYKYGSNPIIYDTATLTIPPSIVDTFTFITPISMLNGIASLKVFTSLTGDIYAPNDTAQIFVKGLNLEALDYSDNFDSQDLWFAGGTLNQWELGAPSTQYINSAHSGINAWVTRLSNNYAVSSQEYLYSPYFSIPANSDTAILSFYHKMRVVSGQAYGILEYTINNGTTWSSMGYIGDPTTTNWYNTNLNGQHVWSSVNASWIHSAIKLDPQVFNNGQSFQIRFAFISLPHTVSEEGWAIDDFSLSVPKAAKDAGVTSILSPGLNLVIGDSVSVTLSVKNFGSDTLFSIPLRFTSGSTVLNYVWNGVLVSDSSVVVTLPSKFFVSSTGNIQVCATTLLVGDGKPSNNSICKNLNVGLASVDAAVVALISPANQTTISGNIAVSMVISNEGTDTLYSIPVGYLVGTTQINENYSGVLYPGDTAHYNFTSTYISPAGSYLLKAFTSLSNDAFNSNDTLIINLLGTGIKNATSMNFVLGQNVPNPTTDMTMIPVYLPYSDEIRLTISTLDGRMVLTELHTLSTGSHSLKVETKNLSSGVYFYTVVYKGVQHVKKLIVN